MHKCRPARDAPLLTCALLAGGFVSLVLELPNSRWADTQPLLGLHVMPSRCSTSALSLGCRKMESEADEIGLSLAARACFKPGAAVSVYQILDREEARQGGAHMPAMLRTHPMSSSRIEAVRPVCALPRPRCSSAVLSSCTLVST